MFFSDSILRKLAFACPVAQAMLHGSLGFPQVSGTVSFYELEQGTAVCADVAGLPEDGPCAAGFFGFHIHAGHSCTGNAEDEFADAGAHYDAHGCPHPAHSGDMPPLPGSSGRAWLAFLTDRFAADEVIGRTVIVHAHADDLTMQPSGGSGARIACGVIERLI